MVAQGDRGLFGLVIVMKRSALRRRYYEVTFTVFLHECK